MGTGSDKLPRVEQSPSFLFPILTVGPTGSRLARMVMWFTEEIGNRIGQITPSGTFTEFPVPTSNSDPYGITAGPDGNLSFTELTSNKIGRVNMSSPSPTPSPTLNPSPSPSPSPTPSPSPSPSPSPTPTPPTPPSPINPSHIGNPISGTSCSTTGNAHYWYVEAYECHKGVGIYAQLNQWEPYVDYPNDDNGNAHSLAEIVVYNTSQKFALELGWIVWPGEWGDTLPHLFVFPDFNPVNQNCYNQCGWHQVSTDIFLGQALPIGSTPIGYGILFYHNNWWIWYKNEWIGYYSGLQWGGPGNPQFHSVQQNRVVRRSALNKYRSLLCYGQWDIRHTSRGCDIQRSEFCGK